MTEATPTIDPTDIVTVRPVTADEWRELRGLRLEALADTPIGFAERHADAVLLTEQEWRDRARRGNDGVSEVMFVAVDASGTWCGMTGVFTQNHPLPTIFAVFVQPHRRGQGVADQLFRAAFRWVAARGDDRIRLSVHEDNERARSFYRRVGFTETGRTVPYRLDESRAEYEMERSLDDQEVAP